MVGRKASWTKPDLATTFIVPLLILLLCHHVYWFDPNEAKLLKQLSQTQPSQAKLNKKHVTKLDQTRPNWTQAKSGQPLTYLIKWDSKNCLLVNYYISVEGHTTQFNKSCYMYDKTCLLRATPLSWRPNSQIWVAQTIVISSMHCFLKQTITYLLRGTPLSWEQ